VLQSITNSYKISKVYRSKLKHEPIWVTTAQKDRIAMKRRRNSAQIDYSMLLAVLFSALVLVGCASGPTRGIRDGEQSTTSTRDQIQGAAGDAARQPLRDIGLMKKKIPYALSRIADPYAEPSGPGCPWISYELTQLSAALGSEVSVMPVADRSTTSERGSRMAIEAARDVIRGSGSQLLPGRSVIRRLSGASNADELYDAAKQRGMVRRGYLKGLSDAKNCG
jgi:hypothetical protein